MQIREGRGIWKGEKLDWFSIAGQRGTWTVLEQCARAVTGVLDQQIQ